MYICVCKGVTDSEIKREIEQGACSMDDLCCRLDIGNNCGQCSQLAQEILDSRLPAKQQHLLSPPS